jgi:hypothetical protein
VLSRQATIGTEALVDALVKDPSSVLDYGLDWTPLLHGDSIVASSWSVKNSPGGPDDLHVAAQWFEPTLALVWLTGGVLGSIYLARNTIGTAGGRTEVRNVRVLTIAHVADRWQVLRRTVTR